MVNDEFETPQWLFDKLNDEFNFQLDVAATKRNKKTANYVPDALDTNWLQTLTINDFENLTVFMNPPYSRGQLYKWCKKAYEESQRGVTVVGLLPVDTSTKWFHEWIKSKEHYIGNSDKYLSNIEIRFLPKRLKFELNGIPQGTARFASMIVIWRGVKC